MDVLIGFRVYRVACSHLLFLPRDAVVPFEAMFALFLCQLFPKTCAHSWLSGIDGEKDSGFLFDLWFQSLNPIINYQVLSDSYHRWDSFFCISASAAAVPINQFAVTCVRSVRTWMNPMPTETFTNSKP